ncbi:MAM and LDL-receptor class A domain-containing protein 1-like [Lytechinus pictus]|uniref:MAM and LDL-receptor class A domain-containing protein 1-like n=1 Tax=Lytechinus pictus TaxID=7653 RepID=UPI0030B9C281
MWYYTILLVMITPGVLGDASVPNFDCDFESDQCGWTSDLSNNLVWTRNSGPTSTPRTGPSGDHTSGSGFYLYIEAAGASTGDKATIISPTIPALPAGGACVSFWYHMLGTTMGTLTVYSPQNQEKWKKAGDQGNLWMQANVWLQSTSSSSQMYITGELGGSHYSDMAIDDLSIKTGIVCQDDLPDAHSCDFDQDFCSWSSTPNPKIKWIRHSGPTQSTGTGPSNDHTKGDKTGYYIYVEASGAALGAKALLISDVIKNSDNGYCMDFWYHMFGASLGVLSLYQKIEGSDDPQTLIWTETQPRGPQWNQAQLQFTGSDPYRLVVEGGISLENIGYGDIAVDDISFHDGKCPTPNHCDFESGDCGYTPGSGSNFNWNVIQPSSDVNTPSIDSTYRTAAGHVLFADISSLSSGNQKGIIETGMFDPTGVKGQCFQFWYYVGTSTVSVLKVFLVIGGERTKLWEMHSASHPAEWHVQEANLISTTQKMKISFEASSDNIDWPGGIAIDDITLADFPCSPFGSCDFENGYCTWKNEENDDDTNWLRNNGMTISFNTGADVDHTYGTMDGEYIYLEGSYLEQENAAILKSTVFTADTTRCFGFWYFMMGSGIGNLITQITAESLSPKLTLRTIQGNKGYGWKQAFVPIQPLSGSYSYEILLKGTIGPTPYADISIDDITVENRDCSDEAAPVTHNCDFESDLCYWYQDEQDDFNWVRASGVSDTAGTGPGADHTYGNDRGYYIYTEASGLQPGNVARLLSNLLIDPSEGSCMEFWYQMYGMHLGSLNVYMKIDDNETALWSETESRGPHWIPARVQINTTERFTVIFEGIRGPNYQGDIALDDITFTTGDCGTPSYCGFENGLCGFTQPASDIVQWALTSSSPSMSSPTPTTAPYLPPFDATYRTPAGHFMYLELHDDQNNNDGGLSTGVFPTGTDADRCLNVWFYMQNSVKISLKVNM